MSNLLKRDTNFLDVVIYAVILAGFVLACAGVVILIHFIVKFW